jgi:hypothetical protein
MRGTWAGPAKVFNTFSNPGVVEIGFNNPSGIPTTMQHIIPQQHTEKIQKLLPDYNQNMPENMMELPYNPEDATVSGLSMQRGGHRPYNKWVEAQVDDWVDKNNALKNSNDPEWSQKAEQELADMMDDLRCMHIRRMADQKPEQVALHKNDPNISMTHRYGASSQEAEVNRQAAPYLQRLHEHNLQHNPAHAALNEQAASPQPQMDVPMRRPVLSSDLAVNDPAYQQQGDGVDKSCPSNPSARLDAPQGDEQEQKQDQEQQFKLVVPTMQQVGSYLANNPSKAFALMSSARNTAASAATIPATNIVGVAATAVNGVITLGVAATIAVGAATQEAPPAELNQRPINKPVAAGMGR